jgi:hypothetical protein
MLASFFGEAEIPLRGNIEAPAQQMEDDDNSDSPAAIGIAQWRSRLATSLPALPERLSTKSALQCVQTPAAGSAAVAAIAADLPGG